MRLRTRGRDQLQRLAGGLNVTRVVRPWISRSFEMHQALHTFLANLGVLQQHRQNLVLNKNNLVDSSCRCPIC